MGRVQRLADGAAQIGFESVPVAAVLVEMGGERRLHGVCAPVQEMVGEAPLFEDTGREPDELLGAVEGACSCSSHGPTVGRWTLSARHSGPAALSGAGY